MPFLVRPFTQADWPASSPWVTAVGGTSIGVGAGNSYLLETGWGTRRSVWADTTVNPPNLWPGLGGNEHNHHFAHRHNVHGALRKNKTPQPGGRGV